jgi:hypothetical protein
MFDYSKGNNLTDFLFKMKKEIIYNAIKNAVEKEVEPNENWEQRNDEDSVMCRAIVINILHQIGYSRSVITELTKWKKSCVVNHINTWNDRKKCSRILVVWHTQIVRELCKNPLFEGLLS